MSSATTVNPYDVLQHRRKLKQYKKSSAPQTMKLLRRIRDMNLNNKMLITTQIPRTLIWLANKTSKQEDEDVKKMNKMCRYLAKEWKKQLGVATEKKKEQEQNVPVVKVTTTTTQSKIVQEVHEKSESKAQNGGVVVTQQKVQEKIVQEKQVIQQE